MRIPVARVRDILFRPTRTWAEIAEEPGGAVALTRTYVAPLAAIPAVCGLIGTLAFGENLMGVTWRPTIPAAIGEAVVGYVVTLGCVWALAFVVNLLAPIFGAVRDFQRAFKLAAYAGTAAWVVGVFDLFPAVGWLAMLLGGLWSLVLLYLGIAPLIRPDGRKVVSYFAMALLTVMLLAVILGAMTSAVRDHGGPLYVA